MAQLHSDALSVVKILDDRIRPIREQLDQLMFARESLDKCLVDNLANHVNASYPSVTDEVLQELLEHIKKQFSIDI